jgi:hypothetical protein
MLFEYRGFTVHRLGLRLFLITGQGFIGYEASPDAARKTIDGIAERQCAE